MQQKPLRVMQVVYDLKIGGGQEVVRTLVEKLAECGCVPVVCAFEDGPLRHEIERLGIAVEILPDKQHSIVALPLFIAEMLRIRRALIHLVDKYEIDVIQTQLLRIMDLLVPTLKFNRCVLVFWTFQNARFTLRADHLTSHQWLLHAKRAAYRVLYRVASHWVDGMVAVSDDVKRALEEYFGSNGDKITVIYNSVDVRRYQQQVDRAQIRQELGLPDDVLLMAVVATFKVQKGHRILIDALPTVVPHFPRLHILLIGDGEQRDALARQVAQVGMDNHVHFLGFRQDIPQLLAASDYFVLPSLWEGLPMALIEAMASGLPVIATSVSGSKQVVVDDESGLLVRPGATSELARAMLRLLSDPELAASLGNAALARVAARFGATKQAEDHVTLYRRGKRNNSQVQGEGTEHFAEASI